MKTRKGRGEGTGRKGWERKDREEEGMEERREGAKDEDVGDEKRREQKRGKGTVDEEKEGGLKEQLKKLGERYVTFLFIVCN